MSTAGTDGFDLFSIRSPDASVEALAPPCHSAGWRSDRSGLRRLAAGFPALVINRPTLRLRWDDLDAQACAGHGSPDWDSMIVVGPTKVRDGRGNVSLQWTVTVQCQRPATEAIPTARTPEPEVA